MSIRCTKKTVICSILLLVVVTLCGLFTFAAFAVPASGESAPTVDQAGMSAAEAAVLGLVEGLTEYLPVSSTGHLLFTQHLLGIGTSKQSEDAIHAYEICIQAGAILAVLILYTGRFRSVVAGIFGKDPVGRRLALNLIAAFLPAAVIGLLLGKHIKDYLFGMWPVAIAWFVGGIAILIVARKKDTSHDASLGQQLEQLTIRQSLAIGGMQCIAMWPGVSRSLITILGGMFVGLSATAAVEFSFLLGLVTLSAASMHDAKEYGALIFQMFGWINPLIGIAVACISAIIAVKWMVGYLTRHGLAIFGYYRIALGLIVAAVLLMGYMAK